MDRHSILVTLRKITKEFINLDVPLTEDLLQAPNADGTRNVDAAKVFRRALELGKQVKDGWIPEEISIDLNPIQGNREQGQLVPIDFNSLSTASDGKVNLSDYYMDYAFFFNQHLEPQDGQMVTFYDSSWNRADVNTIMCLNGVLRKRKHQLGSWGADLSGRISTQLGIPKRYFNSFIGATTRRHAGDQNLGARTTPESDKLDGVSVFTFPAGTQPPDFSKVIGMSVPELAEFFQFKDLQKKGA